MFSAEDLCSMENDTDTPSEPESIDISILPVGYESADSVKIDDEFGIAGSQAIGGLAGDSED